MVNNEYDGFLIRMTSDESESVFAGAGILLHAADTIAYENKMNAAVALIYAGVGLGRYLAFIAAQEKWNKEQCAMVDELLLTGLHQGWKNVMDKHNESK
jgi:hypothetical protein